MTKLKQVAEQLRLIAEQFEHGVTKSQANDICEELDKLVVYIDFQMAGKRRGA